MANWVARLAACDKVKLKSQEDLLVPELPVVLGLWESLPALGENQGGVLRGTHATHVLSAKAVPSNQCEINSL